MLTADDLDHVYATYTSARWRGDATGQILEEWFQSHWADVSHGRPETDPAAVSPHGAGGRGIFWYEGPTAILGFVPGRSGCYVFKRSESLPAVTARRSRQVARPERMEPVAHFQAGTYARYLSLEMTSPAGDKK